MLDSLENDQNDGDMHWACQQQHNDMRYGAKASMSDSEYGDDRAEIKKKKVQKYM